MTQNTKKPETPNCCANCRYAAPTSLKPLNLACAVRKIDGIMPHHVCDLWKRMKGDTE